MSVFSIQPYQANVVSHANETKRIKMEAPWAQGNLLYFLFSILRGIIQQWYQMLSSTGRLLIPKDAPYTAVP